MDRVRSIYTGSNSQSRINSPVGYCTDSGQGLAERKQPRSTKWLDTINDEAGRRDEQGGRRPRQGTKRPHRVDFSLTGEEFELLDAAAERAGRARGAYAAADTPFPEPLRELIRASGLVRRIGVSLNQAVARLNATGQRSGDLLPYAAESLRRAEHLDAAAEEVRKALR
jgi:hypothetical protein